MFRKLSILVLAVSAIAVAEISLGVDVLYRVNDYERESSESNQEIESGNSTLNLMPFLGIRPNDIIEVSPFFGYYLYVGKRKQSVIIKRIKIIPTWNRTGNRHLFSFI